MSVESNNPVPMSASSEDDPAILAALAFSVPPAPASPADPVRARLLARAVADVATHGAASSPTLVAATRTSPVEAVAASPGAAGAPRPATSRPVADVVPITRGSRSAWWVAGLASLAAAASLLLVLRAQTERATLRTTVATLEQSRAEAQQRLDSLAIALAEREQQLASVTGPDVAVVELASTLSLPPAGRMFWDRASARWTFVANNLPQLAPGRTYTLWLVTADRQIPAGNFTPDANGTAVVRATYELPRTALAAVAVTEEPGGGVPKPTGDIFLIGTTSTAGSR